MGNESPGGDYTTGVSGLENEDVAPEHEATPEPVRGSRVPFGLTATQASVAGVAAVLVLGLAISTIWLAATVTNYRATIESNLERITALTAERDAAEDSAATEKDGRLAAERENATSKAAAQKVELREGELATLEAETTERVAGLDAREAALKAREDASLKAQQDAAAANKDWWITQVRECLARPGGYRMASATEGSLGRDVSCMSG